MDWLHHSGDVVGTKTTVGVNEDGRPRHHYAFHPDTLTFHAEPDQVSAEAGAVSDTGDAYTAYYVGRDIQGTIRLADGGVVDLGEDYVPLKMGQVSEVEHKLGKKLEVDGHPLHRDPAVPFVHTCTAMCDDAIAHAKAVYADSKPAPLVDDAPAPKRGGRK